MKKTLFLFIALATILSSGICLAHEDHDRRDRPEQRPEQRHEVRHEQRRVIVVERPVIVVERSVIVQEQSESLIVTIIRDILNASR